MKTRNMHFIRHVTYLAVILGMTGCGLPDREVPVSPQMVTTLDGGSVIAPGNVLADSGSGLGDDNDAGVDGVLNDAGHTETGYVDAGEGAFGPEADGGTGITEQPCASSADCFGDAPKCDLDLLVCGACTIECGDDRYCVVDALRIKVVNVNSVTWKMLTAFVSPSASLTMHVSTATVQSVTAQLDCAAGAI